MEIYSALHFNFLYFLLFFSSFFIVVTRQWRNKKQISRFPPSGPWTLPILGSLHHLIGRGLPHHILRSLAKKYGPLMYLQLGEVPVVVISSPIIAKEVLRTHDRAFVDRPKLTSTKILFYNCKDIKFTQYGDYWRQMRRICIIELLSAKMVKSFSAIREDELSNVISSIRSMREQLSGKYADRNEFITIVKGVLSLIGGFDVADLFPSWKLLHNITGVKSRLMSAQKKVDVVMQQILNEHIENKAAGKKANGEFGDEDLIDVLLRVKENVELQFPVINDHIKAVLLELKLHLQLLFGH
ncbi:hypothetical protein P3S68_014954 [Capsicum galapagoense]